MTTRGEAGRRRSWTGALCAGLSALLFASSLLAQSSASGIISGTVRSREGVPVPGVQLTARRADGSYERRDVSAADGTFRLAGLPPGSYDVTARRLGYRPVITTGVAVSAAVATTITVTVDATAQTLAPVIVNRTGVPPGRETDVSPVHVTAREIAELPVGLDVNRLVALTPGARPDQMWGGAGFDANAYRLDGVSINHPGTGGAIVQPSVHWIEQLDVRGLGAGADQGGFQGGLVDIVTKSGSNTRLATISANMEDKGLNATNLSGTDIVPELAGRRDVSVEASGPLVHDKLFYFVAGQWVRTHQRALDHLGFATYSPVQEIADARSAFGKLTWTPTVNDLVNFGVALGDSATDNAGLTGRETAAALSRVRSPSTIIDGSWQHTIGANTIVEAKVVSFQQTVNDDPYNGADVPGVATYQLGTSDSYQNAPFIVRQHPTSLGFTLTADQFLHWHGDHHVRIGTEQQSGGWQNDQTRTAGMTWRPRNLYINGSALTFKPGDASTWEAETPTSWGDEVHVNAHVNNGAVFLQDDYQVGRVGIHPGVRYGWWSGTIDPYGGGAPIHALSTNGLDPRLGLTVDVGTKQFPAGVTVHWGRYHQDLFAEMFDRVSGANAYSNYEVWEYGGPSFSDPTKVITLAQRDSMAAAGSFRQIEFDQLNQSGPVSNYHQPFVDQFVVGLHADPTPALHLEATFVARDYRDMIALVDKNEATNYIEADSVVMIDHAQKAVANFVGQDDVLVIPKMYIPKNVIAQALALGLNVPGELLQGQDLTWNPQYEITNPAGAQRRFRQVQVNAEMHQPTWEAYVSLAITSLRGNFSTVSGYDPNSITGRDHLVGRGPGPWVRPNELINDTGELDNASHGEFKLRAIRDIGDGFRGGFVLYGISGDRLTPTFTLQPYAYQYVAYGLRAGGKGVNAGLPPDTIPDFVMIPLAGQRVNLAPTGSYHYAGHMTLDLHLERPIVAAGVEWNLQLDAFNVLGSKAVTLVNTSLDASTDPNSATKFASPLGRVEPRTLRLGASASW